MSHLSVTAGSHTRGTSQHSANKKQQFQPPRWGESTLTASYEAVIIQQGGMRRDDQSGVFDGRGIRLKGYANHLENKEKHNSDSRVVRGASAAAVERF